MKLPELLTRLHIPADFKQEIFTPSPIGTLVWSAVFVIVIGAMILAVRAFRPTPTATVKPSFIDRVLGRISKWDRNFVYYATYIFGTHYRRPLVRKFLVVVIFSTAALFGALLPWPTCLVVISFGLLGVFVIFRQWSHIEDDKVFFVERPRSIRIDGDINFEVVASSLFILIFAPVAFAQLQLAKMGFHLDDKAGPFAFEGYTLIEILKIAPLVQYYDLYADILDFRKLGTVNDPSFQAKFAVVAFRLSSDLIILGVLKRFIDMAKRVAAGLDLKQIMEDLSDRDEIKRNNALDKLGEFALENKPRAKEYLGEVVTKAKYNSNIEVGVKAAEKLIEVAKHVSKPEANYLLNDLIIKEFSKKVKLDDGNRWYADFCEMTGDALLAWANRITGERGYKARLKEAREQYTDALRHNPRNVQRIQKKQADAQRLLNIEGGAESAPQDVLVNGRIANGDEARGVEEESLPSGRKDSTENADRSGNGHGILPNFGPPPLPHWSRLSATAALLLVVLALAGTAVASYPWWKGKMPPSPTPEQQHPGPAPQGQGPAPQGQSPASQGQGPAPQGQGPAPQGQGPAPQGQQEQPIPPKPPQPPDVTASLPLVFSSASLSCGKEPPISWKFGEFDLIESDPVPLSVTSCRLNSVNCNNSIVVVGVGMASSKGTDASESNRAMLRGIKLATVLRRDLKQQNCPTELSVSAYVLNLGRFNDDQQDDKPDQRQVIALIGTAPKETDDSVAAALQKYAKRPPWTAHYTACDLYKLDDAEQPTLIQTQTKICGDQSSTAVSQQ
jgi:hypothetical protein